MNIYQNKVVVVTGAASGIGRALCEELAKSGAIVIITDIDLEGSQNLATNIGKSGGRASAKYLDVRNAKDFITLLDEVVTEHQRLDYIFNNAGIGIAAEVQDMSIEHWQRVIEINLMGVVYGCSRAYQIMVKQGSGHIVNIASLAGLIGAPTMTAYAMTKSAVIGLSNSLRIEGQDLGVKVSVVCPGFIETNIFNSCIHLGLDVKTLLTLVPFKMLDATQAAKKILAGVSRNRQVITFPSYGQIAWWLSRLSLSLVNLTHLKTVRDFRAKKVAAKSELVVKEGSR